MEPLYLAVYLTVINIFSFAIFGIDKSAARSKRRRISEKFLIITALLGGASGELLGMKIFRHKTLKPLFKIGLPLIFLLNIFLVLLALRLMNVI